MIDFAKLRGRLQRPSLVWRYVCQRCKETKEYVCRMPAHMLRHTGFDVYPRCGGGLVLVEVMPEEDDALVRCPTCAEVGRHDPVKGPGWIDPACATCGGDGAVKRT